MKFLIYGWPHPSVFAMVLGPTRAGEKGHAIATLHLHVMKTIDTFAIANLFGIRFERACYAFNTLKRRRVLL